ncbi:MAG: PLP-dependent decarboxylase, partial [Burkholderiaceae bacterium]
AAALAALETPCFVFDPETIMEDHARLRAELGTPLVVSMKANPVLDVLVRCNEAFGDGIEIASLGELNTTVGRMTAPRYVNTPALDAQLAAAALACRATVIADSPRQVALVREAAAKARGPVRLALRLNAAALIGADARRADHFGMDPRTLWSTLDALADGGLKVVGLHVFAGSNRFAECGAALAAGMADLVSDVRRHAGAALEFVNLGGGFPANWRDAALDFAGYRAALDGLRRHQVAILHEAGRAVFARGGSFVTRVVGLKSMAGRRIAVCDGGLAQCFALAQTESFVKRARLPVRVPMGAGEASTAPATELVGSSCSPADVIGRLDDAPLAEGDLLVFDQCGAYTTYSPAAFLNLRAAQRYVAS